MSVFGKKLTKLSSFETTAQPGEQIIDVDPDLIDYLPQQRSAANPGLSIESLEELGQSMARDGQQQASIVRPNPDKRGRYIMVAGERRGRAAKLAGLNLKVVVREITLEEHQRIQRAENIHREALTNQEIAQALTSDKERLGTLEAVAKEWQRSINWVSERLRYLHALDAGGAAAQAVEYGVTADVSTITDIAKLEKVNPAAAQDLVAQAKNNPGLNVRQAVRSKLSTAKETSSPAPKEVKRGAPSAEAATPVMPPTREHAKAPVATTLENYLGSVDESITLVCDRSVWSISGGPASVAYTLLDTLVNAIWELQPEIKIQLKK